jgi:hypothetical protein
MTVKTITDMTPAERTAELRKFRGQMSRASLGFARTLAESYHNADWSELDQTMDEFLAAVGVTSDDPLPRDARREVIELTKTASLPMHIKLTGASKATVARDRAALGISDTAKSDAIKAGIENKSEGESDDSAEKPAKRPVKDPTTPGFDLNALLMAMDAEEIADIVVKMDVPKVKQVARLLSAYVQRQENARGTVLASSK